MENKESSRRLPVQSGNDGAARLLADPGDGFRENRRSGTLRILVMDDDPVLRRVLDKMLSNLDCEVITVVSGEQAIQTLGEARRRNIHYDAAMLDLTVPGGKGGKKIVADIKSLFPEIKTIAMSGYTCDPVFDAPGAFGFHCCLKKPFLIDELSSLLNEIAALKFNSPSK